MNPFLIAGLLGAGAGFLSRDKKNSRKKMAHGGQVPDHLMDVLSNQTSIRKSALQKLVEDNHLSKDDVVSIISGIGRKKIDSSDVMMAVLNGVGSRENEELVEFAKSGKAFDLAHGGKTQGEVEIILTDDDLGYYSILHRGKFIEKEFTSLKEAEDWARANNYTYKESFAKGGVTGSYWEDKGKYQKEYEKAYKMLVPDTGEADAGLPEALRAISRIGYDYYNNGFANLWDCTTEYDYDYDDEYYEYEECEIDRFYENLIYEVNKEIPYDMSRELDDFIKETEGGRESNKDVIIDRILDHIMEKIKDSGLIDDDNFAKGGTM